MREAKEELLCCEAATARAAVDEFCNVLRSGQPKNPMGLLLTTLLRHRRLAGGDVVTASGPAAVVVTAGISVGSA